MLKVKVSSRSHLDAAQALTPPLISSSLFRLIYWITRPANQPQRCCSFLLLLLQPSAYFRSIAVPGSPDNWVFRRWGCQPHIHLQLVQDHSFYKEWYHFHFNLTLGSSPAVTTLSREFKHKATINLEIVKSAVEEPEDIPHLTTLRCPSHVRARPHLSNSIM